MIPINTLDTHIFWDSGVVCCHYALRNIKYYKQTVFVQMFTEIGHHEYQQKQFDDIRTNIKLFQKDPVKTFFSLARY